MIILGVVSVYMQYNYVYYCDTYLHGGYGGGAAVGGAGGGAVNDNVVYGYGADGVAVGAWVPGVGVF
jgi:hypothetical protein